MAAAPRPDPVKEEQHLLLKISPEVDVVAFLFTFERVTNQGRMPEEGMGQRLVSPPHWVGACATSQRSPELCHN